MKRTDGMAFPGARRKYGNVPTRVGGLNFASKAEARRYEQLLFLLRQGRIGDLECQPKFPLVVNGLKLGSYIADFAFDDLKTGQRVFEDVKGVRTPIFNLKAKLVKALHGVVISVVKA